jgi:hypothetical protein
MIKVRLRFGREASSQLRNSQELDMGEMAGYA